MLQEDLVERRRRDRDLAGARWFADAAAMARDPEIDVVAELIGGSDGIAREVVAGAIAAGKHVVSANKALLADLPPGETDTMSRRLKRLSGSPADEFEARLLVWLAVTFAAEPIFATGTNAGYWSFAYGEDPVLLSVIGAAKNTMSTQLADDIAWRLRVEEPPPGGFIERMKQEFTAGNPVVRRMSSGAIRIQFNAKSQRPDSSLARSLARG